MIKVEKLNKFYNSGKANQVHVTNNISLEFESTGLVCILGESGCGKTTLMNEIGGLDDYIGGKITIDDTVIKKYSQRKFDKIRTKKFGYIFQNNYLLHDRTVLHNIELILDMYNLTKEEKRNRIDSVLRAVDLEKYKKRLISQLSGGQQQRVAIARALAKAPSVIFADEPTGNLDETNTLKIMTILKKISKSCLVILVTHNKNIDSFFADRVIYMSDGKVVSDKSNTDASDIYKYKDNSKLYLKEYDKKDIEAEKLNANIYNSSNNSEKIKLNIVYQNNKAYISSPDVEKVQFLNSSSGIKMVDENCPRIDMENISNSKYELSKLDNNKIPKLRPKELLRFALTNLMAMGKRRLVLSASLFILSIFISVFVADWYTVNKKDVKSYVNTDKHIIKINTDMYTSVRDNNYNKLRKFIFKEMLSDVEGIEVYPIPTANMVYRYSGFSQIEKLSIDIKDFCFVNSNKIDTKNLICGRLPERMNEIVIDKWVIDKIREQQLIAAIITNYEGILNKNMIVNQKYSDNVLTVVGVSNNNCPNVYINQSGFALVSADSNKVCGISELNKYTNGKCDNIQLKNGEALVSKKIYDQISENKDFDENKTHYYNAYGTKYFKIIGYFDTPDFIQDAVIADEYLYEYYMEYGIYYDRMYIYADNPKGMIKYLTETFSDDKGNMVGLKIRHPAIDQTKEYLKMHYSKIKSRQIISITVFVIAMVILYFSFRTNVIKQIKDISVYRLLGISKLSIINTFLIEIAIITTYSSVIGCLLSGLIINFISGIRSLNINFYYPWYMVLATIGVVYLINFIISIIPVNNILRLSPAKLSRKFDM